MAAPVFLVTPRTPAPVIATPATSAIGMTAGDASTPPTPAASRPGG